jgi:hypothetical protein
MFPPSPPLTPFSRPTTRIDTSSTATTSATRTSNDAYSRSPQMRPVASPSSSPDFALPPPFSHDAMPLFELPESTLGYKNDYELVSGAATTDASRATTPTPSNPYPWRADLSPQERDDREVHLSAARGRPGLRIVIVTENFLPKVDGVTRTLARLLEHLEKEGHRCMLLGPETNMESYASHPLVGTAGVPLVVYPGLKLNFLRPRFLRSIKGFVSYEHCCSWRKILATTAATGRDTLCRSYLARRSNAHGDGARLGWRGVGQRQWTSLGVRHKRGSRC